ncbi:MAG: hypothetical protein GVY36_05625 [Verrucomicrobia bacterium]|jgi:predicted restriction endonuclease|nr:hypothetical protein [Verrucomicrobiota bacterium]
MPKNWKEPELWVAMNVYCRLPFGQFDQSNKHIIGWSDNEARRADPTNGICLNALHDKAFDRHLITFDEDFRVVLSPLLKSKEVSEFHSHNFERLEGRTLCLPHRFLPDPDALAQHRETFSKSA